MLDPQHRNLLLEILRPPPGYQVDHAIGTTFSLDLHALLMAPLAFTFFNWEDDKGNLTTDPLALLESVRRNAGQVSLFCQEGQISVPRKLERLFAYLEDSVHEVRAPSEYGVFHPKTWLLRYTHEIEPVYYRFVCLSRNLTFDKSWDTVLVLDGLLSNRRNAYGKNNPLGDFFQHLPGLATYSLPDNKREKIELMQYEVRRVEFEMPDGVEDVSFHPIGVPGYNNFSFTPAKRRMLIMSPFISDKFLKKTVAGREDCVLISMTDSLEEIKPETLGFFKQKFFLSRDAETEEVEDDLNDPDDMTLLSGLHAKLFVMDDGWKANVWTGSANATNSAFKNNIEFLVRLRGKRTDFGIDKLLMQEKGRTTFADMLQEYRTPDDITEKDPLMDNLEKILRAVQQQIMVAKPKADVTCQEKESCFNLSVTWNTDISISAVKGVKVKCWPVTLPAVRAVPMDLSLANPISFSNISLDAITSFFAFELECSEQTTIVTRRFVSKLPLNGLPDGRLQHLLRSLLKNKSQVLRLLLLLLADNSMPIGELLDIHRHLSAGSNGRSVGGGEIPLLESLLKALAREPEKIDRINKLVSDLQKSDADFGLLPDDFMEIWKPIWEVRKEMIQ